MVVLQEELGTISLIKHCLLPGTKCLLHIIFTFSFILCKYLPTVTPVPAGVSIELYYFVIMYLNNYIFAHIRQSSTSVTEHMNMRKKVKRKLINHTDCHVRDVFPDNESAATSFSSL